MPAISGHLALRATRRDSGRTVLGSQSFRAPFHLSKPYWDSDTNTLIVQVVNPTAGILAGDRLESVIAVESGAALLVTTPSASRVFKMKEGTASSRQEFSVANGGWLEVMPEPLVPHRGSRFHQATLIDVAPEGTLFYVDQLMPGRIGHGEAWQWQRLCLEVTVRVGGELALRERWDQSGASLRELSELGGTGGKACFANAVLIAPSVAPDVSQKFVAELSGLHGGGRWVGVSALRRGGWSFKLVARDALELRRTMRETRRILSSYFPRLSCDPRKL